MTDKIKFNVNVYKYGFEDERISVSSNSTLWISAVKTTFPVKEEANLIEAKIRQIAKGNKYIHVRKHYGKPSDSTMCNNLFNSAVDNCKLRNSVYDEIKAKIFGLGIDQKEVEIGSEEFESIKKSLESINKNIYWKLDPVYDNFSSLGQYKNHLNNLKNALSIVTSAQYNSNLLKETIYI